MDYSVYKVSYGGKLSPEYIFIEDGSGVGTGVAFRPPFCDKLEKKLNTVEVSPEKLRSLVAKNDRGPIWRTN